MSPHTGPRRRSRWFRFLAIAAIFLLSPIFVLAATIAATGTMTVQIHEAGADGLDLWLPIPAMLADVAIAAAPRLIPSHEMQQMRREVEPYLPALREFAEAIEELPSATFVQVEDGSDRVRVAKRGGKFEISVESPDGDVRISLPVRLAGRVVDFLD